MNNGDLLKPNTTLKTAKAEPVHVIKKLGGGGQGEVYLVKWKGGNYALKWYFEGMRNEKKFKENLKDNIKNQSPDPMFLWPLEYCEDGNSFGYIMDLRPADHFEFSEFLLAKKTFSSIASPVNACLNIVHAFRVLHRQGYSYQDLNDGNFFIRPSDGHVLICDNDNVSQYGTTMGIAGKCRYMAPEIVVGSTVPNNFTDRFSLSVILFMMLFLSHPLEGQRVLKCPCMTQEYEINLYGKEPLFIFDKNDASNRPDPSMHINAYRFWPVYPEFIHDMFYRAFSQEAMHEPNKRLMEKDWEEAFVKLRDQLIMHDCGRYTFIEHSREKTCIACKRELSDIPRLHITRQLKQTTTEYDVFISHGKYLYEIQTSPKLDASVFKMTAEVKQRKENNVIMYGLCNLSDEEWIVIDKEGNKRSIPKGKTLALSQANTIYFDRNIKGEYVL